ncbi:CvpA family protein [Cellulosilyticum sp. I15G10I2]|uniref:CvpA family protein n=1 Tax=Cellulosilyticum sp. I15G10I2 TaxID=1892843 RepID=UPI00085C4DC7|nr:CvpA family protein [Cellulosilyticum sp. I15G10I2]
MLDLIIIGIIIVFGMIGYYTGLLKTIITLLSSIIAFVLSFLMYPIINSFLKLTPIYGIINKWIASKLAHVEFGTGIQTQGNAISENITWLPKLMSEQIIKNNNQEVYKLLNVSHVGDYVSTYLTHIILSLLSLLVTWLILKILLTIFLNTTHVMVSHLPVVSTVNKIGGLGAGIGKGLLSIWIVCLLVPFAITYPYFAGIEAYIADSQLAKWLYENNMILVAFHSLLNI